MKPCRICKAVKPLTEFHAHRTAADKQGMDWSRYGSKAGQWNLDHRQPVCSFDLTNNEERLWAFHYSNIRPMWANENAYKSNKILPCLG